ncbi:Cellulose synthase-like protein [Actinidia chinensis var. chinensis]|uniref:Cellulose synthase-like protein n=1 Tax=Actinidia chinensis var. chinensis TaxID=1590841 RepID=A0A2R6QMQ9_ACTCC|nr:Cellulose synthase-like protein [Actinidia chinensis var. chinensis]
MAAAPLHKRLALPRTWPNRAFFLVYSGAIFSLLYHHSLTLLRSPNAVSLSLFVADLIFAFMWVTYQGFRMAPVRRDVYPQNLTKETSFPAMDVFICTADPYKEPPMRVVNTALSVMAYDYPTEKMSLYVSDDGGSQLTLFAIMEASKFAAHWLAYCKKNALVDRCPEAYFATDHAWFPETAEVKNMYESMKMRVEKVVERGSVPSEYITDEQQHQTFSKWTAGFTNQDHPTVLQVLLESGKDKDIKGQPMPNLIYIAREKSSTTHHNFKAGALNVLIRVSAAMTNSPIILTLDCDMYSNDPQTPLRAMCFHLDTSADSKVAYVQFPQIFHGLNKHDIYCGEFKYIFQINPAGMDGVGGPPHVGTGCFFRRRALFGGPTSLVVPENPKLGPDHRVTGPIQSKEVLSLAHQVAGCNFEAKTVWGYKVGYRYGTYIEDFYSGFRLQCEGWISIFCQPKRPAFLGDAPMTLIDLLIQTKRWSMGLLAMNFSKDNPMTLGLRVLNPFLAFCYIHYIFWPIWAIPITIYAFLPQLALLNSHSIFPKVSDPWCYMYVFLFFGAYAQDFLEFVLAGGTIRRWWNCQRMWIIRGISSFAFGFGEFVLEAAGLPTSGFNVTNKVVDADKGKRYEQGIFDFGVASPMYLPLTMGALINLIALVRGICQVYFNGGFEDLFLQLFLAGFGVINSLPVFEAMALRTDYGKIPVTITLATLVLASGLCYASSLVF